MSNQTTADKAVRTDLILISVAVIWGLGFPLTQNAINLGFSSAGAVAARFSVAAVALGAVFWREIKTMTRKDFIPGMFAGLLTVAGYMFQTVGIKYTTPSNNAFLSSTGVIMVPIFLALFFKDKPGRKHVISSIGCFVGAAVLTIGPGKGGGLNVGDLLTLLCAAVFSLQTIYIGRISGKISSGKLSFLMMSVSAFCALVYVFAAEKALFANVAFPISTLPTVLFLGLFASAYGFFGQSYAQKYAPATKASIILSTEGIFGSLFSVLLGYEPFTLRMVAGGGIIFLSLVFLEADLSAVFSKKSAVADPEDESEAQPVAAAIISEE